MVKEKGFLLEGTISCGLGLLHEVEHTVTFLGGM